MNIIVIMSVCTWLHVCVSMGVWAYVNSTLMIKNIHACHCNDKVHFCVNVKINLSLLEYLECLLNVYRRLKVTIRKKIHLYKEK